MQKINSNGLDIAYDIYAKPSNNGILIQISHGMIEHRGKYAFIASKLSDAGYIVVVNDHRGHGDSINNKDIFLGEMGEDGFEKAVDDLFNLNTFLRNKFSIQKFVLIGHSMGSLIARRYLQKYESSLDLLILCGTPSFSQNNFGLSILKLCKFFRANKLGASLAHKLSFTFFNSKYKKTNKPYDSMLWINRDESELQKNFDDPKCNFIFTLNSFINLLHGLRTVFSPYNARKLNLPILFISGDDDACGGFGFGALKAYKHLHSQNYENVKLILYAKARHELFLEKNKNEVAADVLFWIEENLKKT